MHEPHSFISSFNLPADVCVEVLRHVPILHHKLALASTCKVFRTASKNPRAWQVCVVQEWDVDTGGDISEPLLSLSPGIDAPSAGTSLVQKANLKAHWLHLRGMRLVYSHWTAAGTNG